jgi:hypothetical protein
LDRACRERLFALPAECAALARAIPARESVPFEPDIVRLEGALGFTFVLVIPEPFAAPFIWLVVEGLSVPDCVPVPAAMTGAASNPNAHAETSSPAFTIDRIPSYWIAGG